MRFDQLDFKLITGKTVILDIDGTLVPDGEWKVEPKIFEQIITISKLKIIYLSTNKKLPDRNISLANSLGVKLLLNNYRKPDVRSVSEIPSEFLKSVTVIGDKCITDGWLAARLGAQFIKVDRVRGKNESFLTKVIYWLDNLIYAIIS